MNDDRSEAGRREVPLTGYSDRMSLRPEERISFKVSSTSPGRSIEARLFRSISADPNPDGPGVVEQACDEFFAPAVFEARHQPLLPGSCALTDGRLDLNAHARVELSMLAWPTLHKSVAQCLFAVGDLSLELNAEGSFSGRFGPAVVKSESRAVLRRWVRLRLILDKRAQTLTLSVDDGPAAQVDLVSDASMAGIASIAARMGDGGPCDFFNGKIESPQLQGGADRNSLNICANWDFAIGVTTTRVEDTGPERCHAQLLNMPARAMKGASWDGRENCWRHAPEHYAAIHFHEDDLIDAGWQDDLVFDVPAGMPSGVYVMRISDGENEDAIPFWVCAPRGRPRAALCVLVSTFTYAIYGNHARPDWAPDWQQRVEQWQAYPWNPAEYPGYGLSTYNDHVDGSGICHASHRRPLFNLRPGYVTFGAPDHKGSGLRHFQADSHLIAWLHAQGIAYDIITDRELHDEGRNCIAGYKAVTTGTHPEYHTAETLDALTAYRDSGGHLLYLGGNGFYWRVALHEEDSSAIEIRRAEAGIRAWAAEPGEYWQAFDGAYGGLWRRNGRPPQALVGVGFSAQGQMSGSYYRRRPVGPDLSFIFEGIDTDIIGDFGLCGGGAAGFELDRADTALGTSEDVVVLAASEGHDDDFVLVPEEVLTHLTTVPGPPASELLRADMIWQATPAGGAVFSVGSITFCSALPCNDFDNDVSRLLGNVLDHMLS